MALGPICWFGTLMTDYALQPIACVFTPRLLPMIGAGFLIPLLVGLVAAVRQYIHDGKTEKPEVFIELLGVITPSIFLVAQLWMLLASVLFHPCE
jgi:hypothetical protein